MTFTKDVAPLLLMIFLGVTSAIFLIRIILNIVLLFLHRKYTKLVKFTKRKKDQFSKKKKFFPKEDEVLFREKMGKKRSKSSAQAVNNNVELIPSQQQQSEAAELAEVKIVDIVKPVGFWTSVILGQKLTYLVSSAQLMNKNSKRGFWVSMVEAQEKAAGRQKGRSR